MNWDTERAIQTLREREHPLTQLSLMDAEEAAWPYKGYYPHFLHEDVYDITTFVKAVTCAVMGDGGIMDEARWTVEVQCGEFINRLLEEQ